MDARVPGGRGAESQADKAEILSELKGKEPISALNLSRLLGCTKAAVQRCLYQLSEEGRVQKVGEKLWKLAEEDEVNGNTGEERGPPPIESQADRAKVLSELKGTEPISALNLSRLLGCKKAAVQRCLYQLSEEGRVQKVGGKLWKLAEEDEVNVNTGEERGAGSRGPAVTWNEVGGERRNSGQSQTNVTNFFVLGNLNTTYQQAGTTSNYITTHVQGGASYVQVGSGNIMQGEGSNMPWRGDPGDNAQTDCCSPSNLPGDPRGSAEDQESNVTIITEELMGLQIGNANVIINQADMAGDS
ncbi:uncharacterized protein LOC132385537 isoform X2 [Hypanus sabinus]|uniref:uncharacterized protein LOC132385537 isoform X2 n=1 Tax=Hypanus sabinus TaxID=79690 RepID=UPI0028C390F4|nr:uncharacterized protein LOC132385537 isoform X2 [Hypanus sabinus]